MVGADAACIICESLERGEEIHRVGPFGLVCCPGCGLVRLSPQPDDTSLAAADYHDEGYSRALLGPLRELTLSRAKEKLELLRDAGVLRAGARVLDVGSSSGAFLEQAAAAGMRATGVEVGATTAAAARDRGLDVPTGTLEEALERLGEDRFDLVTFWDVRKHVRNPRRELRLARGLLAEGGRIAATFPNIEGWYPRATHRLIAGRTGFWEHPEVPVHLYDFAPATARALFARCGLGVELLRTLPVPFEHYRETTLSIDSLGGGRRARATRLAFEALRLAIYSPARLLDRSNSLFVCARAGSGGIADPGSGAGAG
ncbi:MAG: class I SAM-dependent methyltransferase [Solirubrobacterales bacterium]